MIPSSAALVGAYWERLLVLPLEQRRVAGREPRSEQRSEGQPGYLGASRVHLHHHRAPISATQPTATRRTDLLRTDIRATPSPAMAIRATRETPLTPVLRAMDTQVIRDSPVTPVLRALDIRARRPILPTPIPVMDTPWLAIRATAPQRSGLLGPSTSSSLQAEVGLKLILNPRRQSSGQGQRSALWVWRWSIYLGGKPKQAYSCCAIRQIGYA